MDNVDIHDIIEALDSPAPTHVATETLSVPKKKKKYQCVVRTFHSSRAIATRALFFFALYTPQLTRAAYFES